MGLIGGVAAITGYAVGVFIAWALRAMGVPRFPARARHVMWWGLLVGGLLMIIISLYLGGQWQAEVRGLVGEEPTAPNIFIIPPIALVVSLIFLFIARGIRLLTRVLIRGLDHFVPLALARVVVLVVLLLIGWWIASGILPNLFINTVDGIYSAANASTDPGVTQPVAPERSGSPESLVSWDSLGKEGRNFVAGGPSKDTVGAFSTATPMEPIRVYVGMDSATTPEARADLAVAELQRTGAFDRDVLVVAGVTGTGWLEPQSVNAIEYLWAGNTAIVGAQYSFLPSWMSFIIDRQRPAEAGQALFDAVYGAWEKLPADHRPKLIAYGLSLGSYAMQSAFATLGSIATQTDGALFVGTPNFTLPWHYLETTRDPGSPMWKPIYRGGVTARFAPQSDQLMAVGPTWPDPRVVYLQHASDPVVWWSYDLFAQQPDWLVEPRGPDVSPHMRWIPVITFLQVTVDQFFGVDVPNGHGHNYPNTIVEAWNLVTSPPDVTPESIAMLQAYIDAGEPSGGSNS